jgi:hypothetical protein
MTLRRKPHHAVLLSRRHADDAREAQRVGPAVREAMSLAECLRSRFGPPRMLSGPKK